MEEILLVYLIFFLLLVKEDYLWLDCTCIPQPDNNNQHQMSTASIASTTNATQDNSVMMKLLWNIGKIMDEASNVATYYAIDGWKTGLLPPPGVSNGLSSTTIGFLRLYQCLFSSFVPAHTHEAISELHHDASTQAWCFFEQLWKNKNVILNPIDYHGNAFLSDYTRERFRYKRKKSLQDLNAVNTSNSHITTHSNGHSNSASISPRGGGGGDLNGIDANMIVLSFHEHRRLHLEHLFSLNCSNHVDLIPITALLYQKKLLPFLYRDGSFLCSVKRRPQSAAPSSSSTSSLLSNNCDEGNVLNSGRNCGSGKSEGSYGWYRCPIYDEKLEKIRTRYYFALHCSSSRGNGDSNDDKGCIIPTNTTMTSSSSSSSSSSVIIPKKEKNYDYFVLMIHEECLEYCSRHYELEYLPYDDMNDLHSYFLKYSQAYDWNHYEVAFCQLCTLKERLVYEEEHHSSDHSHTGKGGKAGFGVAKDGGIKRLPQRNVVKVSLNPHHRR